MNAKNLGREFNALLKEGGFKATDVAKVTGLTQSLISRLRQGRNRITNGNVAKLAHFWAREPDKAARLQAAHLLDQLSGPGAKLVRVSVAGLEKAEHHID